LEVAVRFPTDEEIAEATDYVKPWADRKPKTSEEVYALETIILSKMPKTRHIQLQAIAIGTLGIVGIPNEVFAETGLNIKKYSPFKTTYSISLANGAFGYIPPPEQHVLGGYTTWRARSSCLEVYAEPKIKFEVLKMLERVKLQRPAINQ
jgi:neutral ceramidase